MKVVLKFFSQPESVKVKFHSIIWTVANLLKCTFLLSLVEVVVVSDEALSAIPDARPLPTDGFWPCFFRLDFSWPPSEEPFEIEYF